MPLAALDLSTPSGGRAPPPRGPLLAPPCAPSFEVSPSAVLAFNFNEHHHPFEGDAIDADNEMAAAAETISDTGGKENNEPVRHGSPAAAHKKKRRDRSGLSPGVADAALLGKRARTYSRDPPEGDPPQEPQADGASELMLLLQGGKGKNKRGKVRGKYQTAKQKFKALMDKFAVLPGMSKKLARAITEASNSEHPIDELDTFIDISIETGEGIFDMHQPSPPRAEPGATRSPPLPPPHLPHMTRSWRAPAHIRRARHRHRHTCMRACPADSLLAMSLHPQFAESAKVDSVIKQLRSLEEEMEDKLAAKDTDLKAKDTVISALHEELRASKAMQDGDALQAMRNELSELKIRLGIESGKAEEFKKLYEQVKGERDEAFYKGLEKGIETGAKVASTLPRAA